MKKIQRLLSFSLVCLILGAFISGCSDKDPLIGTWVEPVSGIFLTFDDNGKVVVGAGIRSYTMTYETQDPDVLVIHVSTTGTAPDITMNYKFDETNNQLTLIVNGVETIFDRKSK